jgi:hypothetical protein
MKSPIVRALFIVIASAALNFVAFLINYRLLAFPFLSEEQRVVNASSVLTTTLGSFVLAAVIVAAVVHWLTPRTAAVADK